MRVPSHPTHSPRPPHPGRCAGRLKERLAGSRVHAVATQGEHLIVGMDAHAPPAPLHTPHPRGAMLMIFIRSIPLSDG
jgi:hypothetical protein